MENINKLTKNLFNYIEDSLYIEECDLFFQTEEKTREASLKELEEAIDYASEKEKINFLKNHYIPFKNGYIEVVFYEPEWW